MTLIAARRYHQGHPLNVPVDLTDGKREPPPPGCFDWIGLHEPDSAEMERVRVHFGLHPLAAEDALHPRQLPKVEPYGNQLFIVARTAELGADEQITYGQTALFLGADFVVTVRFGSSRAHTDLRRELECQADRLSEGPDYVVHAVLDFVVDGFLPIMDRLDEIVTEMEEEAIDRFPEQAVIRRIFHLRRQLRSFQRIIGPMEEVCHRLAYTELPAVDPSARIWFRDVLDHIHRAMARTHALADALAAIVESAALLEQHRLGEMTRRLGAWAAILAVPTAIAGIYGMNFEFMPELHWKYGYFVVVGFIFSVCGGLALRFRQIGWL